LEYGDVKWIIKRTAFEFFQLDLKLKNKKDLHNVPSLPTGILAWIGTLFHRSETRYAKQAALALERRRELQKYLLLLIEALNRYVSYDLNEFLELSAISITRDMGWKGKEGYLENKVERFGRNPFIFWKRTSNERWEREWVIVRDSYPFFYLFIYFLPHTLILCILKIICSFFRYNRYIAFCSHISSTTPSDVFLMDKYFKCNKAEMNGIHKVISIYDYIKISNSSRRIELKGDKRTLDGLMESIHRVKTSSPWIRQHRFDSYAPIREGAKIKWYVDGKDYFFAVSQAILAAKSEIYIEDWWLSPELVSKRYLHIFSLNYSNYFLYSIFVDLPARTKNFD
jgi:hypothetical protein